MRKYKALKKIRELVWGQSTLVEYLVELPNKKRDHFRRRQAHDVATVIPLLNKTTVIMVRQYRFGSDEISLEFPKGKTDGEDPQRAAKRELKEETGYDAKKWKLISVFRVSPAWNSQKEYIYEAIDLSEGPQRLDETEIIEVEKIKIRDIASLIKQGEITDAPTIAAFYLWQNNRK